MRPPRTGFYYRSDAYLSHAFLRFTFARKYCKIYIVKTTVAKKPIFRDKRRRVWELDFLRGFAVIAMCFDHLMFDLAFFRSWFSNSYEVQNPFMDKLSEWARAYWSTGYLSNTGFRFWAHYLFVFLFLFLVGVSCALSRDNTKRGSLLGVVAFAFTGVSLVLKKMGIMEDGIVLGILHCIALSILCVAAADNLTKFDKRVNLYAPLVIGVVILAVGIGKNFWTMTSHYDQTFVDENFLGYIFGTHAYGDDWFGLFPYAGCVFLGMYWGKAVYSERLSLLPALDGKWNKPVNFVGRHALIFYLAHQVAIAGLVIIVCLCIGYDLQF